MSNWTRPQMTETEILEQIKIYKKSLQNGWISNTDSSNSELIRRLEDLGFTVGPPWGTEKYSPDQAAKDGLVGIYWKVE